MLSRSLVRGYSTQAAANSSSPIISSTLLLSRNPIVTAELPRFETQYYKYQNELWRRLMWTFPSWYYYRPGTLADQRYKELNKHPIYNNPNLEFPRGRPDLKQQRDRRFKQVVKLPKTYKEGGEKGSEEDSIDQLSRKIVPNSRITEADQNGDLTSLERKLSRTLYLIINNGKEWILPNFPEESSETLKPLHKLAEDGLTRIGGNLINYFNVSKTPCHLFSNNNSKEFFIKSHILSGEFKPQSEGLKFMWLTKEELSEYLNKEYYQDIAHLLNDQ